MKTRTKKCKNCKEQFTPYTTLQKYCSKSECIRVFVEEAKAKEWNKKKAKAKEDLMTIQDYIKLAQQVFNKYIRLRDKGQNCISCFKPAKKENAGHYMNANNHWSVRFDEDNVHLQCEYCNSYLSGNLAHYTVGLIAKIGQDRYDELIEKARKTRKFTIYELKEIIATYRKKIKELAQE